ncbi:PRTRC system protein B [Noviherbaspirillum pedocola]|uniref:PRTRC system protein B n=1 Tax=Noviherbaspirillum pedocola TaxID=2801341 RepID=A0A934W287_9BURK|nr:PRTRC system protein B [Noviherbaspirillum pedocola]MBK4736046.1 PRTRC system protein B [Noviherbaspirillum pedocola]
MQFDLEDGAVDATLTRAILLYETKANYAQSATTVLATVHDVADVGTAARPNVQIMPGLPITKDALVHALGTMAEEYLVCTDLLPERLLGFSPKHLFWWRPAGKSRVFFRCKELGQRAAIVPHPPLAFIVSGNAWYVFALAENKRPTLETELFHAPYFNVYDTGSICIGSANIPDKLQPGTLPLWESAFFDSEFTHVNGSVRKVAHERGEYAFWKEMLDGAYDEFPTDLLVPQKKTVKNLLDAVAARGGARG